MKPIKGQYISSKVVFEQLERDCMSGKLQQDIKKLSPIRYQQSLSHPGCLEMIDSSNHTVIGTFRSGKFESLKKGC